MEYERAREHVQRADRLLPNTGEIRFEMALLDRDEGLFGDALTIFTDLLETTEQTRYTANERQTRQQLLTHVAIVQTIMSRYRDAVRTFGDMKALMRTTDDGTIDSYIVDTLRMGGEAEEALNHAAVARRTFPQHRQLRIMEADLTADLAGIEEGASLLREMISGTEQDRDVYSTLVGVYEKAGNYAAAQAVLDEMLENLEYDETAWFLQGALYERQEDIDAAESAFRSALEIDPENPATLNYLGYMLADRDRNLQEALGMIQAAVRADPINGAYLDSLGWVYYRLEQMDLAERFLTRAILFSGSDPTLHEHLGDLYRTTGRTEDAREAYLRSLERAGDEEERDRVRQKLQELPPGTI
jgi:tetratricopeptide (TPR) repeat protein